MFLHTPPPRWAHICSLPGMPLAHLLTQITPIPHPRLNSRYHIFEVLYPKAGLGASTVIQNYPGYISKLYLTTLFKTLRTSLSCKTTNPPTLRMMSYTSLYSKNIKYHAQHTVCAPNLFVKSKGVCTSTTPSGGTPWTQSHNINLRKLGGGCYPEILLR